MSARGCARLARAVARRRSIERWRVGLGLLPWLRPRLAPSLGFGALAIAGLVLAGPACRPDEASEDESAATIESEPSTPVRAPASGDSRPLPEHAVTPEPEPEPRPEPWIFVGSGFSSRGWTLSHEHSYRIEGDELWARIDYLGDDDQRIEGAVGHLVLDGLEIVEGPKRWTLELEPGEDRRIEHRLRPTRDGRLSLSWVQGSSEKVSGTRRLDFDFDEFNELRRCPGVPASVTLDPNQERLAGERVTATVENRRDEAVELSWWASPEGARPRGDLPRVRLEPGERREFEVDRAQGLLLRPAEGGYAGSCWAEGDAGAWYFIGPDRLSCQDHPPGSR